VRLAAFLLLALVVAGCSRQETAWRRTESQDTVAAYESYLREYPAGAHAGRAQARLAELRELQEWERAQRFNTPEAYQRYLSGYPSGHYSVTAREKLSDFLLARAPDDPGPASPPSPAQPAPGGALLAAAGATGDRRIQLGAFGAGEAAARREWSRLAGRHGDLLAGTSPRVDVIERNGRSLWRLQAGPLTESRAREVCTALKARGEACLLVGD